jgi:hypothetical protein
MLKLISNFYSFPWYLFHYIFTLRNSIKIQDDDQLINFISLMNTLFFMSQLLVIQYILKGISQWEFRIISTTNLTICSFILILKFFLFDRRKLIINDQWDKSESFFSSIKVLEKLIYFIFWLSPVIFLLYKFVEYVNVYS